LVIFVVAAFWSSTCFSTPSAAQKGETAALSARISDLSPPRKICRGSNAGAGPATGDAEKIGPVHRDVAAAMNNLAQLYGEQGNDVEASAAEAGDRDPRAVDGAGFRHDRGGADQSGGALSAAGTLRDAEPLFRRALAVREKSLGRDHPDVGQALNKSGEWYEKQGRHGDSERMFRRALAIYEKAAGPEHPAVATLLNNLGQVDKVQGRYGEAEPLIKRSLAIREKVLGREHPDVARSLEQSGRSL